MMASIFPRHVIDYLTRSDGSTKGGGGPGTPWDIPSQAGRLARSHKDVSILFMDIVGECANTTTVTGALSLLRALAVKAFRIECCSLWTSLVSFLYENALGSLWSSQESEHD